MAVHRTTESLIHTPILLLAGCCPPTTQTRVPSVCPFKKKHTETDSLGTCVAVRLGHKGSDRLSLTFCFGQGLRLKLKASWANVSNQSATTMLYDLSLVAGIVH